MGNTNPQGIADPPVPLPADQAETIPLASETTQAIDVALGQLLGTFGQPATQRPDRELSKSGDRPSPQRAELLAAVLREMRSVPGTLPGDDVELALAEVTRTPVETEVSSALLFDDVDLSTWSRLSTWPRKRLGDL